MFPKKPKVPNLALSELNPPYNPNNVINQAFPSYLST